MASIVNTFTDTVSVSYTGNGKAVTTPVGSYTGTKDAGIATVVTAGSTNVGIPITFPFATIQSFVMAADQDVTVKVNSSAASPADTFLIKKTAGMIWGSDYVSANPFTADVTEIYVTNSGATDAKFNLRVLYN